MTTHPALDGVLELRALLLDVILPDICLGGMGWEISESKWLALKKYVLAIRGARDSLLLHPLCAAILSLQWCIIFCHV